MGNIKLTKETKEEILKISYKYTSAELAEMYNCSRSTILKIWMDNNYHKRKSVRYYVNHGYFENIDTANKAYILGFIAADGTMYKRDNCEGLIQIKLQQSDEQILKDILVDMDSNYPVRHIKNGKFEQVMFSIVSQKLYDQLLQKGIHPNKTWDLNLKYILSNISEKFHIDFIRGYFDGDGCITKIKDNQISKVFVGFSCPYNFGLDFQKVLKGKYDIDSFISIDNHKTYTNDFCTVGIYGTSNKYKLLKIMYYENALCLKRKYERGKQLIHAIEINRTNRVENINAVNKFLIIDNSNTGGFGSTGK